MTIDELLAQLQGVRSSGRGWIALCPAHEDRNPSLSIHLCGGKILFHCHAGCAVEAICAALSIEVRELFLDAGGEPRIVAEYNYTDESGTLLFQSVRYDPKGFRQRRPDGNGGWIWNLKGVQRVLYQLREVLRAKSVIIVEGEKDVETGRKLGLAATCNAGGVGKWREEHGEYLRGKRVAVIVDADEPGRKHALQVAQSLRGKVESLKVVELPGAKDLSEWVEHGGTRLSILDLIRNTPEWDVATASGTGNGSAKGGLRLTSLGDLMLEPEEHISWLLSDKLPAGGLSVLSAKPKVGKSTFARCLAIAIATGETFLGCATTKGPVIYLALEEKRGEVRRHFEDLGATGEEKIYIHAASAPQEAMLELFELTRQIRPVLIVIDPLFKFVRIRDEKAYAEVCNAIEPLLTLARESGAHVLLCHHSGKMERADATDSILGSTAIFGGVDSAIILKKADRYRTVQSSQRYGTDWPEVVLNFEPTERSLSLGVEKSEAEADRIGEAIVAYLVGCDGPQTRVQIEAHVEGKTTHMRRALKALCVAGRVSESGAGARGDPLRYQVVQKVHTQTANGFEQNVNSCSQVYAETREQESQNEAENRTEPKQILVPTSSSHSPIAPQYGEQEKAI